MMTFRYSSKMQRTRRELGFITSQKHENPFRGSTEEQHVRDFIVSPCSPTYSKGPLDITLADVSPIISPLSPYDHYQCRSLAPESNDNSFPSNGEDNSTSFPSSIRWDIDGDNSCWSDAATAGAVLSLLQKEPPSPPPCPRPRFGKSTSEEQHLTCIVCFEDLENGQYPEPPIAAGCDHAFLPGMHICFACLRRSLDKQLTSGADSLTCPICLEQLSDEEVQRWSSRRTFQAYDAKRTRQILEEDVEFVACVRKDCGYGQLHVGGLEDPIVVCNSCGTRTCFIHRDTVWHEGLTCEEYDRISNPRTEISEIQKGHPKETRRLIPKISRLRMPRRETELGLRYSARRPHGQLDATNEALPSNRAIQELTKPCPNCHAPTERAGGCKFMRCSLCRQNWCWECGIPWQPGHLEVDCCYQMI